MEIFPCHWPFVRGIHQPTMDSPHKSQWCGALMFSLICAWTNGWANNQDSGDSRWRNAHYGITVMQCCPSFQCRNYDQVWQSSHPCGIRKVFLVPVSVVCPVHHESIVAGKSNQTAWDSFILAAASIQPGLKWALWMERCQCLCQCHHSPQNC